jgi:Phage integrase family
MTAKRDKALFLVAYRQGLRLSKVGMLRVDDLNLEQQRITIHRLKGAATMSVEYLVLQANAEQGPFARVSAHKLQQSWETLQEALDELGQHEWDLCTTIYSATKERSGPGEHYCEGFIFKRLSYATGERAHAPETIGKL